MEFVLGLAVLGLSNFITWHVSQRFAPTAMHVLQLKREHMAYVEASEHKYYELVRDRNSQWSKAQELTETNYQMALEATPKLTDKIAELADTTKRVFG